MDLATWVLILVSLYIGWNIGANDAANCLGTSVGAGILNYKKALILVGIFAVIGAALQGSKTMNTVGKNIIDSGSMSSLGIIAALLGASILITLFTIKGLPISTTNVVIGSLAGVAFITSIAVNWGNISKIFVSWVFAPIGSAITSYLAYHLVGLFFNKLKLEFIQKRLYLLAIFSGLFLAYGLGANNIGNAMGIAVGTGVLTPALAGLFGGLFIGIGSVTFGSKVMKTVGSGITELDTRMAFAAQMGTAVTVILFTYLAIPVSTSTAIVGGVAGVGVVKGVASIDKSEMFRIVRSWVTTPLLGGLFGVVIYKAMSVLL
ncbi:inorganic phosphate transporter [Candidatus Woesearchaeota archaeon]|nr:inorganic phosphate transporter [Candidatus Woesearchaeota archaeon]